MPPYTLDITFLGPIEGWPSPKKFDLQTFITSSVNRYAAWLHKEYDIEFCSAVIRYGPSDVSFIIASRASLLTIMRNNSSGCIHGGDRNTSDSRDHITVNFKNSWLNERGCHRPAHIVVDTDNQQVLYDASTLFGVPQD